MGVKNGLQSISASAPATADIVASNRNDTVLDRLAVLFVLPSARRLVSFLFETTINVGSVGAFRAALPSRGGVAAGTARDNAPPVVRGAQGGFQHAAGAVHVAAAEVEVERGEAVFRPGVDAQMRFGEQQYAGYTRFCAEVVEVGGEDNRPRRFCRRAQDVFKTPGVAQQDGIAAVIVEQGVATVVVICGHAVGFLRTGVGSVPSAKVMFKRQPSASAAVWMVAAVPGCACRMASAG